MAIAARIIDQAARIGIPASDVLIDPLVMAVGADRGAAQITLETIELVRRKLGVNIIIGASNVSFGLPARHALNQAFIAMAAASGANCIMTDPMQFTLLVRGTDLLRGRDPHAKRYIRHCRTHLRRKTHKSHMEIERSDSSVFAGSGEWI